MKEAAGEANVTVITIVLIGVVAAAGAVLIPRIVKNMKIRSCCTENGGYVSGATCKSFNGENDVTLANLGTSSYKATCQD